MKHLFDMHAQATANNTTPILDEAFIAEQITTTGFEALRADLAAASWDALVEQSGISVGRHPRAGRTLPPQPLPRWPLGAWGSRIMKTAYTPFKHR
ncbi:MAG: hypothetical protein R3E67_02050 [Pseudomonadales bacterium]